MSKKREILISVLLIIIGGLAGCSSLKIETESDSLSAEKEGVTITMMAPSGELYNIDRILMKKYEEYSGNRIDFQEIQDDQYATVLKAKLASGVGPDIAVIWPRYNASQFFPKESFIDLSQEPWVQMESEEAIENQSFENRIIGLGLEGGSNGWGVFYNKEIFSNYGLKVPQSMEEFTAVCETIKKAGIIPLAGSLKEEWTSGVWLANMGALADKEDEGYYDRLNQNTAKFSDSEVFLQFITEYKQIYDSGYLGETALTSTARDAFIQVLNGTAAMALSNCTPEAWITDSGMTADLEGYGMFPVPYADNKMLSRYEGGFIRVINSKSEHAEVCKDYFNFLTKEENLSLYYSASERSTITPAFTSFLKEFKKGPQEQDLIVNSNGENALIAESGLKYWDNTVYGQYITQAVMGSMTPEEALENIDRYRDKMFQSE